MATDLLIKTVNVHKSFKDVKAVQGIDLNIEKGQFVALLGPNGAGKTTMVEMIEGIQMLLMITKPHVKFVHMLLLLKHQEI